MGRQPVFGDFTCGRKCTNKNVEKTAKEAKKYHNLKNCNYYYCKEDEEGNELIVSSYYNAQLDAYGNRM